MEAGKRNIKSGIAYDHLFPKPSLRDTKVKRGAVLEDTIDFIPIAVKRTKWQTKEYVNQELRGLSTYDACEKLWHFLYNHIQYKKDKEGREQIRSPGRSWHDRFRGIDCDCYTTFISTVLSNLNIPHTLRIAKYDPLGRFQHIYPIVPMSDGSYITVDCVLNEFNKEQPYVQIKDTIMDLEFLDGIEDETTSGKDDDLMLGLDDMYGDLYGDDELGWSLKSTFKKIGGAISKGAKAVGSGVKKAGDYAGDKARVGWKGAGDIAKKGLHYLNKLNPATILLRNGLLAAMKLNMFNVAGNLKWSYLSDQDAAKKGINQGKFNSLKGIRSKLDSIFNMAGGEESNLRKAILTGKGNSSREVSGLDGIDDRDFFGLDGMDESTPLSQLLGADIFYSENLLSGEELQGLRELEGLAGFEIEGLSGLDDGEPLIGLGEPATIAIGAASGAMATIAALIKNVGSIFESGKSAVETGKKIVDTGKNVVETVMPSGGGNSSSPAQDYQSPQTTPQSETDNFTPPASTDNGSSDGSSENNSAQPTPIFLPANSTALTVAPKSTQVVKTNATPSTAQGFWEKNKTWLKPALIGAAGLGTIYIGYRIVSGNKPKKQAANGQGLSGVKRSPGRPKGSTNKRRKAQPRTVAKIKLR